MSYTATILASAAERAATYLMACRDQHIGAGRWQEAQAAEHVARRLRDAVDAFAAAGNQSIPQEVTP